MKNNSMFVPELGVISTDTFSKVYPEINEYILVNKEFESSRDGMVKEMLDVKTHLTNPYRRCVGGCGRDINIFFLLAEAMWIVTGRKDVKFLTIFNKQMATYSDDGEVFHAPYGYRLRHWGVASEQNFLNNSVENRGFDQVANAIRILASNPNSRQVVMEIWNPIFDLGQVTKDIPCNDIVMLKIRDGRLITTIGNRSNDLHWGLPTNIFQFSFLTECMAGALGVKLGTQTHNSQSLHIYDWNKVATTMSQRYNDTEERTELYTSNFSTEIPIDFNFKLDLAVNKFSEIECILNFIIDNITLISEGGKPVEKEVEQIQSFSNYLYCVYLLLEIYVNYKNEIKGGDNVKINAAREKAVEKIFKINDSMLFYCDKCVHGYWDITTLALNFFYTRMGKKHDYIGML